MADEGVGGAVSGGVAVASLEGPLSVPSVDAMTRKTSLSFREPRDDVLGLLHIGFGHIVLYLPVGIGLLPLDGVLSGRLAGIGSVPEQFDLAALVLRHPQVARGAEVRQIRHRHRHLQHGHVAVFVPDLHVLVLVAHRNCDVQAAVGAPVVGAYGDPVLIVPVGAGGAVEVGRVAEGKFAVPIDGKIATVTAGEGPTGDGLALRVSCGVSGQGKRRIPVFLDTNGFLADYHGAFILVCDRDLQGKFAGVALVVPGLHRHQVLVAVRAGTGGIVEVGRRGKGEDALFVDLKFAGVEAPQTPGELIPLGVAGPVGVEG